MIKNVLKEKIKSELEELDWRALTLIYEQIKILRSTEDEPEKNVFSVPDINTVHELTSTSKSNWSEDVIAEREERI